jgi:glycosyltransferase involved in cell wall biosynthesis
VIASVLVPTTGERVALLEHSVGSVLAQTVDDLEVLVVGDGAANSTRAWAESVDPRVRWFGFPKDDRRGERNRHTVLTEHARGDIVLYLCDRDLWFADHVATMRDLLADADFAHTLRFTIDVDDQPSAPLGLDLTHPDDRASAAWTTNVLPLSIGGHTMAAYRRLPEGWRPTPPDRPTDRWMWVQFLDQPDIRVATSAWPTVLSFKRPSGWTVDQRLAVLERWSPRIAEPGLQAELARRCLDQAVREGAAVRRRLEEAQSSRLSRWARSWMPPDLHTSLARPVRRLRRRLRRG